MRIERGKSKFNDERSSPGPKLTEGNMATNFSGQASIIFQINHAGPAAHGVRDVAGTGQAGLGG